LPYFDNVTYLYCARDPREIFISMWNHGKNQRVAHLIDLLKQQGIEVAPPPRLSDDINERFQLWCTKPALAWERDGVPFWSVFSHASSFWRYRVLPNVHFLHYADLKSDLAGQMDRIAGILGIRIDAALMPELVAAATFASMKKNADMTAPDTDLDAWNNNADFFNKGEHGQWRGVLSEESLALYDSIKHQHGSAEFIDWMERGFLATAIEYP
jgi:aryl sulfotransferase